MNERVKNHEAIPVAMTPTSWPEGEHKPHPDADEILRQVEFYFSEENLPHDAYLLGFTGRDGTDPVSLSLITGFKKMKCFRPRTAVRDVLKHSKLVQVVDNGHIKRRFPLRTAITVVPHIDNNRYQKTLAESQHTTKGMLKPTGFEFNATEGPIRPEEFEEDRRKYDPNDSFIARIETAVGCFCARRKMHQDTRKIFTDMLHLGGFHVNQNMFQGRSKKDMKREGIDVEDAPYFCVADQVADGYWAGVESDKQAEWTVDFEAIARSFFSDMFLRQYAWYDEKQVKTATQVLRSFYNYLFYHDVCPEYTEQLLGARKMCDIAEDELPKLAVVDQNLPGAFNSACSTLCGGSYSNAHVDKDGWANGCDDMGLSIQDARVILYAGVAAYGDEEQLIKLQDAINAGGKLEAVAGEQLGLEVVDFQLPDNYAAETYRELSKYKGYASIVHPMGWIRCKRWKIPFEAPQDLPPHLMSPLHDPDQTLAFLIEETVLKHVVPGMKFEAAVKELNIGFNWIDSIERTYPSFYLWLPNERVRAWKEPGPPTAWMQRQEGKGSGMQLAEGDKYAAGGQNEEAFNDEEPD